MATQVCATCVLTSMLTLTIPLTGDLTYLTSWSRHATILTKSSTTVIVPSSISPNLSAPVETQFLVSEQALSVQPVARQHAQLSATINLYRVKANACSSEILCGTNRQEIFKDCAQYCGSTNLLWHVITTRKALHSVAHQVSL